MRDAKVRFVKGHVTKHANKYNYINCQNCGNYIRNQPSRPRKYCNHSCAMKGNKYAYKNSSWIDEGYRNIWKNGKNVKEHRMIMEQHLGREITKDEVVHHKNRIKTDNRIENLMVMTNSEHVKYHHSQGHIHGGGD